MIDIAFIAFLSLRAYRDGTPLSKDQTEALTDCSVDTLDHYEVPFFGRLANSFVDDE